MPALRRSPLSTFFGCFISILVIPSRAKSITVAKTLHLAYWKARIASQEMTTYEDTPGSLELGLA